MRALVMKPISCYLIVAMFIIGIVPRAYAGFSPSEAITPSKLDRASDLEKIQKALEMKMVRERLQQMGFTPEEVQARLTQLDDAQLHELALKIDDLRVGGDSTLGIIIALLIIAILVVVLIMLLGHRITIS